MIEEFEREWREGDREKAKEIAWAFVKDNRPRLVALFGGLTREEMVSIVSEARRNGKATRKAEADMWLLSEFEPQVITGTMSMGGRSG